MEMETNTKAVEAQKPPPAVLASSWKDQARYEFLNTQARNALALGKPPEEIHQQLREMNQRFNHPSLEKAAVEAVLHMAVIAWKREYGSGETVGRDWEQITVRDAVNDATAGPPWRIKGLLAQDTANLVAAHPHSMKSLTWLCAAMQAVARQSVWGRFDATGISRVLFLETEDPPWLLKARMRGFSRGLGLLHEEELPGFRAVWTGPFDLVKGGSERIRAEMEGFGAQVTVLSTLQNLLAGRSWNDQAQMQPVNAAIIALARVCPMIVLTHSPWDRDKKRAAGTVTMPANYMFTMYYEKHESSDGVLTYVTLDSKVGAEASVFTLELRTDGNPDDPSAVRSVLYKCAGKARDRKVTPQIGAILEVVRTHGGKTTRQTIGETLRLEGDGLHKALKRAEDADCITISGEEVSELVDLLDSNAQ